MEPGFLLESGDMEMRRVTTWVSGPPEKSMWTGLKIKDRPVLEVATFRCPRCGYLESYAAG